MDTPLPNQNPDYCSMHNQPVPLENTDLKKAVFCQICLQQKQENIDQFNEMLNKPLLEENIIKVDNKNSLKFQFEKIKESIIIEERSCQVFAFTNDNSYLLVGQECDIVIYEFNNGRISKELQRLNNHDKYVVCLYFMKQSNSFISGGLDKTLIIWILDEKINGAQCGIQCVLMNKMEDQFYSCDGDWTIKFWEKRNGSWKCYQSIEANSDVLNMSLSEIENKLIVCESNFRHESSQKSRNHILMKKNNQKEWNIIQTLDFNQLGWRLCFTIKNQFVFATQNSNQLEIYDYDSCTQQFEKLKFVQIESSSQCWAAFPCQFIRSLSILSFKNGNYLNITKINEKKDYELIQSIKFTDPAVRGCLSNDG